MKASLHSRRLKLRREMAHGPPAAPNANKFSYLTPGTNVPGFSFTVTVSPAIGISSIQSCGCLVCHNLSIAVCRMRFRTLALCLLIFLCVAALGYSQAANLDYRISGTVQDPSGAAIPNAVVELRSQGWNASVATDASGHFRADR